MRTIATGTQAPDITASVLDSSTERSILATDTEGAIVLWNEGARRLYGYAPPEIVGRSWTVLHTADDVDAGLLTKIVERVARESTWEGTVEGVRKDRSRFMSSMVVTPLRNAKGEQGGYVVISSDVTQETRRRREFERVQAYTRSLIESAPDAMVIVNDQGEIQLANAETEKLFGYGRDALIGRPVEILMPERYSGRHPHHRKAFFHAPRSRPMGAGLELWGRRQDGSEFPIQISLSPLQTGEGLVATAAIRDVTEQKRVEHELRDANVRLEAANQAKDRFLASMSHELRTPLNAILGFTGTILMELPGPLNDEQRAQLRTVQANGRHLLSLINDLLDLARIESGKLEITVEPVACQDVLEEVAVGLRPLAEQKGVALEIDAPDEPVTIRTDRRSLHQILINLTNNAIKFTDEGAVRLRLDHEPGNQGRTARFSVIDTGCGIRPEDQERLFAAFEQIGSPGSRPYEGTGLGLYICQMLATAIGGAIGFESTFGQGSCFTLELGA